MRIEVDVDGSKVVVNRSWWTGTSHVVVDGVTTSLAGLGQLETHFSLGGQKRYVVPIRDRELAIEHTMYFPFPAFRPQSFRLLLDGELLTERRGF